jgi:hypothetical protein
MHDGGFGESVCSTCRQKFRPNAILSIVDVRLTPGSGWVLSIIGCVLTRANRTICLVHTAVLSAVYLQGARSLFRAILLFDVVERYNGPVWHSLFSASSQI